MDNHKLQMLHSSGQCDWRTPPELYARLDQRFHFGLDLAATVDCALVGGADSALYLGPDHPLPDLQDSLNVAWHQVIGPNGVGFLNPPYSLSLYQDGLKVGVARDDLQWLLIENWARKAYEESLKGFTTIGVFPYAAQTQWFRRYVMGHTDHDKITDPAHGTTWAGHAALDCWRIPHRVNFLRANGEPAANANVNTCIVEWGPNPGFVGPWSPSMRYWSYR